MTAALVALVLAGCGSDDPPPSVSSSSTPGQPSTSAGSTTSPSLGGSGEAGPGDTGGSGDSGTPFGDGPPTEGDVSGAALRDPDGITVGTVLFEVVEGNTRVTVQITDGGTVNAFHGLIVHANDDPSNGEGCVADPDDPPNTWFVSADGHLTADGDELGHHQGDLPNVWVMSNGRATTQVITDQLVPSELVGTAVVLHELPSNAGNVPVGEGPDEYRPNSARATRGTQATGDTGDRIACGVIEAGGGAAGSPVR